LRTRADAQGDLEVVGCSASAANHAGVYAAQVVEGTERHAVLRLVGAACRSEVDVVVVEVAPGRAAGNHAAPAIAGEDLVGLTQLLVMNLPAL
jgi:hypothetical protein